MNRFEYRSAFTRRSRREQAHRTADTRAFVSKDITKRILRYHNIKEFGFLDHTHGRIIDIHIVGLNLRIRRSHLLCDLAPQTRRSQDIRLIDYRQMFFPFHGVFETDFQDTLDLRACVHIGIVSLIVVLIFLPEIHASRQFTDT